MQLVYLENWTEITKYLGFPMIKTLNSICILNLKFLCLLEVPWTFDDRWVSQWVTKFRNFNKLSFLNYWFKLTEILNIPCFYNDWLVTENSGFLFYPQRNYWGLKMAWIASRKGWYGRAAFFCSTWRGHCRAPRLIDIFTSRVRNI